MIAETPLGSFGERKRRDSASCPEDLRCGERNSGKCFDEISPNSERCHQKFVLLRAPLSEFDHQGRKRKRLSARSSGVAESSRSGGRFDSELSHVRTIQTNHDGGRVCGRETSANGQRTLQLGSPSGGVNFFNAICRLLMYEGSFSTRFSDLLFSTDSFVCAESVSAGVGLGSSFSVSIYPLQLINAMVSSTAIILNSRQVGCTRSENGFEVAETGRQQLIYHGKDKNRTWSVAEINDLAHRFENYSIALRDLMKEIWNI
jgi:hypothetical protein